ncbi:hypothetical protein FGIG_03005 [Fasciola gigantica]|uniref:Uncharacterized protein n=1 Tax=Fasciola gigantica TaxID=46835 RepID=A0A504YEA6_FASGI|nr:hypothetical protein FGIG_03005 [Fasciola gigantica]
MLQISQNYLLQSRFVYHVTHRSTQAVELNCYHPRRLRHLVSVVDNFQLSPKLSDSVPVRQANQPVNNNRPASRVTSRKNKRSTTQMRLFALNGASLPSSVPLTLPKFTDS